MKRLLVTAVLAAVCVGAMTGCYYSVLAPSAAVAYYGPTATSNKKIGEASVTSILGLIITGDASLKTAMEKGGITKIHHIDQNVTGFLGILYTTYTIKVYGE
jgi:D-arabinose 5-phosphate isomerase GutQ